VATGVARAILQTSGTSYDVRSEYACEAGATTSHRSVDLRLLGSQPFRFERRRLDSNTEERFSDNKWAMRIARATH
jgi:hypothetical protein